MDSLLETLKIRKQGTDRLFIKHRLHWDYLRTDDIFLCMDWFGDFGCEVREQTRASDLVMIFSVPILLSLVFLLPESIQTTLKIDYSNYSLFNLWSSSYVHDGLSHFSNNLVAYFVLIAPIYLLSVLADERALFHYTFLSFLVVLPVVLSLSNIAALGSGTGSGFSGIGSAFFGFLPVSLFLFIHNRVSEEIAPSQAVVLFLIEAAIITRTYSSLVAAAGILLISVLTLIYDIYNIGLENVKEATSRLTSMKGYFELVLLAGLLFLVCPMLLFPKNIIQDDSVVNILSHYIGLLFGFFGPLFYLYYRRHREGIILKAPELGS